LLQDQAVALFTVRGEESLIVMLGNGCVSSVELDFFFWRYQVEEYSRTGFGFHDS
jgi:hypothetical protein